MAIKGELYVDYNGTMTKAHLTTEAELVEGLGDYTEQQFGERIIRDTCANLVETNSIYDAGTIIVETDTKYFKIADGSNSYNDLEYLNGRNGSMNGLIVEVMNDEGIYDETGTDDVILEYV
jgi:hypothetical protein